MKTADKKMINKNTERTVHYIPLHNMYEQNRKTLSVENVLNHRTFRLLDMFKKDEIVGIKPCINNAWMSADYITNIANVLRTNNASPFICDTSDRYRNIKTDGIKHSASALMREAQYRDTTLPYVMLDGILSNHEISSKTHSTLHQDVYLAGELPNINGLISICMPTSSSLAGLSGAIVNTGMGLASRRGKILQNTMSPPIVNTAKCHSCKKCVLACPVNAIQCKHDHIEIDPDRCINCGRCTEIARFGEITQDWNATSEHFQKATALHALGASSILNQRIIYINILPDATKSSSNGILISLNPVAIDAATIDICADSHMLSNDECKSARHLTDIAEKAGLGSRDYRLNVVAY